MGGLKVGFVLESMEDPILGTTPRWTDLHQQAQAAESAGFDTVWVIDELQWESDDWEGPIGVWECVAIAGGVAASTQGIEVGTWVMSALHRNPALTARIAETLSEISGGRFVFGLGSGHAGRQGEAFGFPLDYTVSRYEEALELIAEALSKGSTTFDGEYHRAKDLAMVPRPDGRPTIPLLLGGHGPRTMALAAKYGDTWSAFTTSSSQPEAFIQLLGDLEQACAAVGRDYSTLGKSIGVVVAAPGREPTGLLAGYEPIRGTVEEIAQTLARFESMGCTRVELLAAGDQLETIESLAPVLEQLKDRLLT